MMGRGGVVMKSMSQWDGLGTQDRYYFASDLYINPLHNPVHLHNNICTQFK